MTAGEPKNNEGSLGAAELIATEDRTPAPSRGGEKARRVRAMFSDIAPTYDLNNRLLSFSIDRSWRRRTVAMALEGLAAPPARVLDVCAGTGDLTLEFRRRLGPDADVIGCDFAPPMLALADRKDTGATGGDAGELARFVVADAMALPFATGAFDVAAVAFGIRNVADPDAGLAEMARVVRPGGRVVVLEFTQPHRLVRPFCYAYFFRLLPWIGGLVSRRRDAYRYLSQSIVEFDTCAALAARMEGVGLVNVRFRRLTMGVAAIHVGERAAKDGTP